MKIRKRYHLKKKMLKKVINELGAYSDIIQPKSKIELLESDLHDIILIDGKPLIMIVNEAPVLTLKGALETEITEKYVIVDMGAVKFLANGADVMSPGITDADKNIKKDDLVIVVDELHKKPLAIGKSLISGEKMIESDKGKAIKTIHYLGDKIWNLTI